MGRKNLIQLVTWMILMTALASSSYASVSTIAKTTTLRSQKSSSMVATQKTTSKLSSSTRSIKISTISATKFSRILTSVKIYSSTTLTRNSNIKSSFATLKAFSPKTTYKSSSVKLAFSSTLQWSTATLLKKEQGTVTYPHSSSSITHDNFTSYLNISRALSNATPTVSEMDNNSPPGQTQLLAITTKTKNSELALADDISTSINDRALFSFERPTAAQPLSLSSIQFSTPETTDFSTTTKALLDQMQLVSWSTESQIMSSIPPAPTASLLDPSIASATFLDRYTIYFVFATIPLIMIGLFIYSKKLKSWEIRKQRERTPRGWLAWDKNSTTTLESRNSF